jgi:hypothetical protein
MDVAAAVETRAATPRNPTLRRRSIEKMEKKKRAQTQSSSSLIRIVLLLVACAVASSMPARAGEVVPDNGPLAGGNGVLVTNVASAIGNGSDVLSVTVGGVAASAIVGQGTHWVEFVAPAGVAAGAKDVAIQSASVGETLLAGAYAHNPAGQIGGFEWDWTRWETAPAMPRAIVQPATAVYSNKIYLVGGRAGSTITNLVLSFDGSQWSYEPAYPTNANRLGVAVYNDALYAFHGRGQATLTNVYRLGDGEWLPATGFNSLDFRCSQVLGMALGGNMYSIGRELSGIYYTNVWRFNGTEWGQIAGLPLAFAQLAGGVLDGAGYVFGGTGSGNSSFTNAYRFDGASFVEAPALPQPRRLAAAAVFSNRIYAIGGLESGVRTNGVLVFDGTNWTPGVAMPVALSSLGGIAFQDQIYAMGGDLSVSPWTSSNVYRYPARDAIVPVAPASGSWTGGYLVAINGSNLGIDGDVYSVTLAGVPTEIVGQSPTQVVVRAGPANGATVGDVVVASTRSGTATAPHAFEYLYPAAGVLGTNGAAVASGSPASAAAGTAFSPVALGTDRTHAFVLTNSGGAALAVGTAAVGGADAAFFAVSGVPSSVAAGGASGFTVAYEPSAVGNHAAWLEIASDDLASPFVIHLEGACFSLSATMGPYGGGNAITLTNYSFGAIANVRVGGAAATILQSGADWFSIVVPPASAAGAVDIVVQTSDNGEFTFPGAYAYRPQGQIGAGEHGILSKYQFGESFADSLGNGLDMAPVGNGSSEFTADGWSWTAEGSSTGGLAVNGPAVLSMKSNYTIRVRAKFADVSGWKRFMYFPGSSYGPYVNNGRLYFYDLSGSTHGPVNLNDQWIDLYMTRDGTTRQATLWQVVDGEVVLCHSGTDSTPYYVAPDDGSRPQWRFFGDVRGYSATRGTVGDVWMWPQALSSNQISEIYKGAPGGVEPSSGSVGGGYLVVISGSNLADPSDPMDLTGVTLAGVAATIQPGWTATQIVVVAGASASARTGDVVVASTGFGTTTKADAFEYVLLPPVVGPATAWRASGNARLKIADVQLLTNAVDPQASAMGISWVSAASTNGGAVALEGRWILYEPPPGDDTPDAFNFRVRNAYGAESEGTAEVLVFVPPQEGGTLNVSSVQRAGQDVRIRFAGIPGRDYDVQATDDLQSGIWTRLGNVTIGPMGFVEFVEENVPEGNRYYRTAAPEES